MSLESLREPLSRERVLASAMALAEREGLAAVTMRRLAADLDVEAMSLYHHVAGKEALLDGLVEALIAQVESEVAKTQGDEDWRTSIRQRFLTAREVMISHRWAPGLIGSRTSIPPNLFGYYDAILGTLIDAGFSYHLAHRAVHAFGTMPLGFAQELFSPASNDGEVDEAADEEMAAMATAFPHLTAMIAAELHDNAEDPLGWCDSQAEFEFTLDLILDGLARQL